MYCRSGSTRRKRCSKRGSSRFEGFYFWFCCSKVAATAVSGTAKATLTKGIVEIYVENTKENRDKYLK